MKQHTKAILSILAILLVVTLCDIPSRAIELIAKWQPYHEYGSDDVRQLTLSITQPYNYTIDSTLSIYDSTAKFQVTEGYTYVFCLFAKDTVGNFSTCARDTLDLTYPIQPAGFSTNINKE